MKAVVWHGPHQLALEDLPVPQPEQGEVLVRTRVVGICGTDLEVYGGRFPQAVPPLILGHEGAGVVEAVGVGVRGVRPGDRVSVECVLACDRCEYCRQGRPGLCDEGRVLGISGAQGEYAEYFVAPERNCHTLPDQISWAEAGLIDTLAGPSYALSRIAVPKGGSVAVFGPGPAGLFFCALTKKQGAGKTILVGTREYRLAYGREFGADVLVNAGKEDTVRVIRSATGGRGVDLAIEASGSESALRQAVGCLKKGGALLVYGVFGGGPVALDVQAIQLFELTVYGSANNLYPAALDLVQTKSIDVGRLITHRLSLEELVVAFSRGLIEKRLEGYARYMKGVVLL